MWTNLIWTKYKKHIVNKIQNFNSFIDEEHNYEFRSIGKKST